MPPRSRRNADTGNVDSLTQKAFATIGDGIGRRSNARVDYVANTLLC
jgi:hypothetical protein